MPTWTEQTASMETKMLMAIVNMREMKILSDINKVDGEPIVDKEFVAEFEAEKIVYGQELPTLMRMVLRRAKSVEVDESNYSDQLHYYVWVLCLLPPFAQLNLLENGN